MPTLKLLIFKSSTGISLFKCEQMEELEFGCLGDQSKELEAQKFLEQQKKLKQLCFDFEHVQLKLPQSNKLELISFQPGDFLKFNETLKTQKSLKVLELYVHKKNLREAQSLTNIMTTICNQ
jgi:hypothetical protein